MQPVVIEDETDMLLAITQAGRMLMFPVSDLPQLSKGKGTRSLISFCGSGERRGWSGATLRAAAAEHADYPRR